MTIFTLASVLAALSDRHRDADHRPRASRAWAPRSSRRSRSRSSPARRRASSAARSSAPGAASPASRSRSAPWSAARSSTASRWHWIFWINVPDRPRHDPARLGQAQRVDRPERQARLRRPPPQRLRPLRPRVRRRPLELARLGLGPGDRLDRRSALILLVAFCLVGVAHAGADAAAALLPQPGLLGHERRVGGHVLRHVRLDLPADAVPPGRARQLADRRRRPHARVDGRDDVRRRRSPGCMSDEYGGRPFMFAGLLLQAIALGWLAAIVDVDTASARS